MFGLFRSSVHAIPQTRQCRPGVEVLEDRCVPATFFVTNLNDSGPGSLRAAVMRANNSPNEVAGPDLIQFADDEGEFGGIIVLKTGDINITDSVRIQGPDIPDLTISGGGRSRIFDLRDATSPITVQIEGMTLTKGFAAGGADGGDGGAINAGSQTLTVQNCLITGNHASDDGGGIFGNGGTVNLFYNTLLSFNTADGDGGAVAMIGGVLNAGGVESYAFFRRNEAGRSGGALSLKDTDATISFCQLTNNMAGAGTFNGGSGGAISAVGGELDIRVCTISGNKADFGGGVRTARNARVKITYSALVGNQATGDRAADALNLGGAGVFLANSDSQIVDCTISGNIDRTIAPFTQTGGGGVHVQGGDTRILNSTIAFNKTVGRGGALFVRDSKESRATVLVSSTILSNSTAPRGNADVARLANQGLVTGDHNLIQVATAGFFKTQGASNIFGEDPQLAALSLVGSRTAFHAITDESPAFNTGENLENLANDQRFFIREANLAPDIGSFELPAIIP